MVLAADAPDSRMSISVVILALTKPTEYSSSAFYVSLQSLGMVVVIMTNPPGVKLSVTWAEIGLPIPKTRIKETLHFYTWGQTLLENTLNEVTGEIKVSSKCLRHLSRTQKYKYLRQGTRSFEGKFSLSYFDANWKRCSWYQFMLQWCN